MVVVTVRESSHSLARRLVRACVCQLSFSLLAASHLTL